MNLNRSNERKWFHIKNKKAKKNRPYHAEIIMKVDYANNLVLHTNTPTQAD